MTELQHSPSRLPILFLAVVVLFGLGVAPASYAKQGDNFSNADLKGDYSFFLDGFLTADGQLVPVAASGQVEADGDGNFTNAVRILNVGGVVFRQEASGTYTVNPNGTGSAELTVVTVDPTGIPDSTESFDFTITDHQSQLQVVDTTPGLVAKGLIIKQ